MPLYVPLDSEALVKLRQLAEQERRRPQDQAALLIEQALGSRQETLEADQPAAADSRRESPDGAG